MYRLEKLFKKFTLNSYGSGALKFLLRYAPSPSILFIKYNYTKLNVSAAYEVPLSLAFHSIAYSELRI